MHEESQKDSYSSRMSRTRGRAKDGEIAWLALEMYRGGDFKFRWSSFEIIQTSSTIHERSFELADLQKQNSGTRMKLESARFERSEVRP